MSLLLTFFLLVFAIFYADESPFWTWKGKHCLGMGMDIESIPKFEIEFGSRQPLDKNVVSVTTLRTNIVVCDSFHFGVHGVGVEIDDDVEAIGAGFQFLKRDSARFFSLSKNHQHEDSRIIARIGFVSSLNDAFHARLRRSFLEIGPKNRKNKRAK
jgi:hypothetical protein